MDLILGKFWKEHFYILYWISLIDMVWNEVSYSTLQPAWKKLWPSCVAEWDFDGFEEQTVVNVVGEIVCMDKSMGLKGDDADVEELVVEDHWELTTEELIQLLREHMTALQEDHSSEEEEESENCCTELRQRTFVVGGVKCRNLLKSIT